MTAAAPPASGAGDVVIARASGVDLHLPIARSQITAVAFRAVDEPGAVALTPNGGGIAYDIAPSEGRPGPETGSVDVGAPAGTPVYSPVDGTRDQRRALHGRPAASRATRSRSPPATRPTSWSR